MKTPAEIVAIVHAVEKELAQIKLPGSPKPVANFHIAPVDRESLGGFGACMGAKSKTRVRTRNTQDEEPVMADDLVIVELDHAELVVQAEPRPATDQEAAELARQGAQSMTILVGGGSAFG